MTATHSTDERNLPKEPIRLIVAACREEKFVVFARTRIVAKGQSPQVINRNGIVGLVSELAEKLAGIQIKRIDATVAEIADQQGITEQPKISGGEGQAPGRVEPAVQNKLPDQISVGVEDVDKPMGRTRHVVVMGRILEGIGDIEVATKVLDAEGSVTLVWPRASVRQLRVGEGPNQVKSRIEHLYRSEAEIGGIDESARGVAGDSKPFVDRPHEPTLTHG